MVTKKDLRRYFVELLAECFGTCLLILIGEGGIANYKFSRQLSHSTLPISISFSVGVYIALMVAGPVSGAHINPAVTISLMTVKIIKPIQCLFYIVGQMIGAFIGAVLVYFVYLNQFNEFDGGQRQLTGVNGTGDIFFTMPGNGIPHWNAFIDQMLITAILMIFIMALSNKSNKMISEEGKPFAFALLILGISCAFSVNAGTAMNPARDFGPHLFGSFVYGWSDVMRLDNYFFSIPILGPIVGATLGVWIYVGYSSLINNYSHRTNHQNQSNSNSSLETSQQKI